LERNRSTAAARTRRPAAQAGSARAAAQKKTAPAQANTAQKRQLTPEEIARIRAIRAAKARQASARAAKTAKPDVFSRIEEKWNRWQKRRAARKRRIAQLTPRQLAVYKSRRKKKIQRNVCRTLLGVLTTLGVVLATLLLGLLVVFHGPSQTFGDMATVTMLETSALKFVPHIYYTNKTVDAIIERNSIAAPTEDTDTSLITINTGMDESGNAAEDYKDIEVFEVNGSTYHGYMMVVRDPSRVSVGVCRENFNDQPGLQLYEIAERYGAVAAINGGAFEDGGGVGNGGKPMGLVFSEGELLYSRNNSSDRTTVGFTQDHKMVVGSFSVEKAQSLGIRDAVSFGPALVINGEPCEVSGISSGLNPRTAIGQRSDGAVLLLVIDGRQLHSQGATYEDMAEVFLEYGAVNAYNLDGGSSSMMWFNGEYVNKSASLIGIRPVPTTFLVLPKGGNDNG